jgi:hypothetical protein
MVNGETKMLEEYSEPKTGMKLDPAIFDPSRWIAPGWVH